jgi:GTP cyclohydrolase I
MSSTNCSRFPTISAANDSPVQRILQPKGVAVMIEGKHQCMCCRGVRKKEGTMVNTCLLGAFKENLATRSEFLALAKN